MDFLTYLADNKKGIEDELNDNLGKWRKEVEKISPKLINLVELFIDSCQGGKRLRGVLVKLSYQMAGGKKSSEILKPAAAFEIFQTAILTHDDVIDLSPLRRGKPTVYQSLGADHYGISQAIGLGDIGLFLAAKIITDSNFPDYEKNKALSCFTKTIIDTGLGEVLDVELPYLHNLGNQQEILTIFHLKTACYTFIGPMQLGAILAGADELFLKKLEKFGESLGIAFQIQDDILGVFGDEKTLGKSVTSDVEEGKNTLLISFALQKANKEQKKLLNSLYGKQNITEAEFKKVKEIFIQTGALDYSKALALKYVNRVKKTIPKITKDAKMQKLLAQMADFLVSRDK